MINEWLEEITGARLTGETKPIRLMETRTLTAEVLGMAHGQEFYCRECCNKEIAEDTNMTVQDFYGLSSRGGFYPVLETATALTCQGCDSVTN